MIEDVVQDRVDAGVVSVIATLDRSLITRRGNRGGKHQSWEKTSSTNIQASGSTRRLVSAVLRA